MDNRAFKDQIYEQFGRLGKSLASPKRLEMLDVLCQGPRTVESLAAATNQTLANASQHLKVLRTARLVEAEKQGLYVTYRLAGTEVCDFFLAFRHLAESRLAEIERITRLFLDGKNVLEAVDQATLLGRVQRGEVVVLDVRPAEEFRNGHIPGALSVPLAELEQRLADMKHLFVLNDAPYGSERSYNALRLARHLLKAGGEEVKIFLIGDAAACAKSGQKVAPGYYNIADMLAMIIRHGGEAGVCGTCMDARGITDAELIEGAPRSTMDQLTAWTQWADKVLVF